MTRALALGLLASGFALAAAALAGAQGEEERGRDLYRFYCSSCHGAAGAGNGPVGPALRTPPADLTRIAARRGGVFPSEEIAAYVDGRRGVAAHGSRQMPVWGRVLGQKFAERSDAEARVAAEIAALVAHLRAIQRSETPAAPDAR